MAIDTKSKRLSMLSFGLECLLFEPDGSIDAPDRANMIGLYNGIPLEPAIIVDTVPCHTLTKRLAITIKKC